MQIAASVWGGPEHVRSWRATDNGLENIAVLHNDNVLILDEVGQVNGKILAECAYMLANGQGKGRSSREGNLRKSHSWRLLFLSSGELGLADKLAENGLKSRGGQEVRFVGLPVDTAMLTELHGFPHAGAVVNRLKELTAIHYGHAGRAFLCKLTEPDTMEMVLSELQPALANTVNRLVPAEADGQVRRVAQRFALCGLAGWLAVQMGILPPDFTNFVGRENVISAMVHMDEKTPHMHFLHVPVTPDGQLSANSIYTRASLKKLQTELPLYLQSRGFETQRGVEQKPGSAKKHLDTWEFKQQQEALNKLILESEELVQSSRQILDALEQREEELKKSIEMYEQQAEEAEKILREDSALPKASIFNYQSVLKKASSIITELKKALAVTRIAQKQKESLQKEVEMLRTKQTQLEAEYTAHRKQSHEEKEELETLLKKMKRLMAGYQEFLRQPEIRPLHLDFVERKRAEQLQRQQEKDQQERERQEEEARQQAEHDQHIRQEPEAVPQRRRSRMR